MRIHRNKKRAPTEADASMPRPEKASYRYLQNLLDHYDYW
jgi:hypothetical protein